VVGTAALSLQSGWCRPLPRHAHGLAHNPRLRKPLSSERA
jgi:hypothetical protein